MPLHWGQEKNVLWKVPLPGPGNSSPIVSHGRVFLTCAEDKGRKRNLYSFDRRTGKELWVRTVEFPTVEPTHHSNPYCASTPVAEGMHVVVWHGSAGVTSRRGVTSVFRAGPEKFELLAMNNLGEPSNATPAISNGQIFLRTDGHLYCLAEQ